jgi:chromosome segregation ATPase
MRSCATRGAQDAALGRLENNPRTEKERKIARLQHEMIELEEELKRLMERPDEIRAELAEMRKELASMRRAVSPAGAGAWPT